MKGGESLGNEEGSEETSEEGSEEEVSPYQDLHAGGKATCSRRFFMPKNQSTAITAWSGWVASGGKQALGRAVRLREKERGEAVREKGAILVRQPHVRR